MSQKLWIVSVLIIFSRCSAPQTEQASGPPATLHPFATQTATPVSTAIVIPQTTEIILRPSATPFVHIVEPEDTLLGIAIRYGLDLEDLLAANPGINPRILTIDQQILIPNPDGGLAGSLLPTATPIPIALSAVQCYATGTDDLWCLAKVSNDRENAVEGISAVISLLDEEGRVLRAMEAFAPLNLLPSGKIMPMGAFFFASPNNFSTATIAVTSSFPAGNIEGRFLDLEVAFESEKAGGSGKTWSVKGTITLSSDSSVGTDTFSLLLIAQDDEENLVGFRKIHFEVRLEPGEVYAFESEVFSLGPVIQKIDVLVEAILRQDGV